MEGTVAFWEHQQKKFVNAQQFLGLGQGVCVNSLKKGKFMTEIFYSNIVAWSSIKFLEKMIPGMQKLINTKRNKRSGGGFA